LFKLKEWQKREWGGDQNYKLRWKGSDIEFGRGEIGVLIIPFEMKIRFNLINNQSEFALAADKTEKFMKEK